MAREIFNLALRTIRGDVLVRQHCSRLADVLHIQQETINLACYDRVFVCGAGKASDVMAEALADLVEDRLNGGLIVTKKASAELPHSIEVLEAGHPVPDARSLSAGKRMLELAAKCGERALVLFALSGGASALMDSLVEPLSLGDLQTLNHRLLSSGAPISEINQERKRISRIKNGGLARAFAPATLVVLVLSDVLGDNLDAIGSGPFWIPGGPAHLILANARTAAEAARTAAESLGLQVSVAPEPFTEEATALGQQLGETAKRLDSGQCFIAYGESALQIKNSQGKGGRCQHAALAAAIEIGGIPNTAILVVGTDGTDGPTDVAGALVTGQSVTDMPQSNRLLEENDSYAFHKHAATHVHTGPTGTNLNELAILVRT